MKQMALRGRARQFDENGVCGPQKLVTSADRTRLLANFDRLFPGAKLTIVEANTEQKTQAEALLSLLSRPGLPTTLSTKWISQQMRTPWRQITQHLSADMWRAIENLGWRYVSRKGRLGSTFERIRPTLVLPRSVCSGRQAVHKADLTRGDPSCLENMPAVSCTGAASVTVLPILDGALVMD
jgi:hypothetical protein